MMLLTWQFSRGFCYFTFLRSKCIP